MRETIEYQSSNRVNLDLNSKINDKNTLRINALVWFDGKENAPQIQEYFLPTDIENKIFIKKLIGIEEKIMMDGSLEVTGNIKLIKIIHLN